MAKFLFFAAPLALAACATPPASTSSSALEQEILATEQARLKAFRDNDRAAFATMVTDDLAMVHSDGGILDKAGEIAVMRPSTPDRPLPTLSLEDTRVRGSDTLAVLTGSLVERQQGRLLFRLRFTNVYVRNGGRWLLASGQLTRARPD
jgi:ketosteroid isomerase-like protein